MTTPALLPTLSACFGADKTIVQLLPQRRGGEFLWRCGMINPWGQILPLRVRQTPSTATLSMVRSRKIMSLPFADASIASPLAVESFHVTLILQRPMLSQNKNLLFNISCFSSGKLHCCLNCQRVSLRNTDKQGIIWDKDVYRLV